MKKIFRRLFSLRKKRLLFIGAILSLFLIYPAMSMLMVDSASLSLEKLRLSFREDIICHDACAAGREAAVSAITKEIREQPDSKSARRLKAYLSDRKNDIGFRLSLIEIVLAANGPDNPPDYIKDLMEEKDSDYAVRAHILASFNASSLSAKDDPVDYYRKIIVGDDDIVVKLAAVSALSSLPDKKNYFKKEQLKFIRRIIFDAATEKRLRQPLVMLLGDYYPLFPEETKNILVDFYPVASIGDNISRAFAADILNRLGGEEAAVPAVSPQEWDEYYNN